MQSTSHIERQSLTKLRVICAIVREWGRLPCQTHGLALVCWNWSQEVGNIWVIIYGQNLKMLVYVAATFERFKTSHF